MTDVADHTPAETPSPQGTAAPTPEGGHGVSQEAGERGPYGGAHPTEKTYLLVALVLACVTALEVGIYYIKGLGDASNPMLLILAGIKFLLVVLFFMHLRFDSRILRRLFTTGFLLAIVVYLIVFLTLGVFTTSHGVHG